MSFELGPAHRRRTVGVALALSRGRGTPLPESRAQFGVHRPAESRHDFGQGFHIRPAGVEVHDAGAQHVAAADDGVGNEGVASPLQPVD